MFHMIYLRDINKELNLYTMYKFILYNLYYIIKVKIDDNMNNIYIYIQIFLISSYKIICVCKNSDRRAGG